MLSDKCWARLSSMSASTANRWSVYCMPQWLYASCVRHDSFILCDMTVGMLHTTACAAWLICYIRHDSFIICDVVRCSIICDMHDMRLEKIIARSEYTLPTLFHIVDHYQMCKKAAVNDRKRNKGSTREGIVMTYVVTQMSCRCMLDLCMLMGQIRIWCSNVRNEKQFPFFVVHLCKIGTRTMRPIRPLKPNTRFFMCVYTHACMYKITNTHTHTRTQAWRTNKIL